MLSPTGLAFPRAMEHVIECQARLEAHMQPDVPRLAGAQASIQIANGRHFALTCSSPSQPSLRSKVSFHINLAAKE